jgi:dTDP-4-amino-4,6-dideoxygalactose transaminase
MTQTGADQTVRFVDLRVQARALDDELTAAMRSVVERGDFILGSDVEAFEAEFAAYCGVAHAVGVDSGFSALELALRAAGIGPGDEVITQANTFIATVGSILAAGATPVLTDCDELGGTSAEAVAAAVTSRTKAVVPVHLFGRIGDIHEVAEVAERAGAAVVEDAAQAHGARLDGSRAGSFGAAAAFSFYPAKNLGAFGDGGMLVTDSGEIAAGARSMRNYGQRAKYEHVTVPLNHRLDTIQAAVLRVKLRHLDSWNASRERLADMYRELLADLPLVLPPQDAPGRHVYHLFVVQSTERDALRERLQAEGIETGIHYPIPLHLQPALGHLGYRQDDFPRAEELARSSLSLPMYPELTEADVHRVATALRQHLDG